MKTHLTESEKHDLLVGCWIPESTFVFPAIADTDKRQARTFSFNWLQRYSPWLAYTRCEGGGALCKVCTLFAKEASKGRGNNRKLGSLITCPFARYKQAIEMFDAHQKTESHNMPLKWQTTS